MANRKLKVKDAHAANEFIHIDLLPRVRRPRQFNVNVLLIVLFAVILSWLLIYLPLASRQVKLDAALEINNDLTYQLLLVNEELVGYRIEENRIRFAGLIDNAEALQVDYRTMHNSLDALVLNRGGQITFVRYNAVTNQFTYVIELNAIFTFTSLNGDIIDVDFVESSSFSQPVQMPNFTYIAIFTIEVTPDA